MKPPRAFKTQGRRGYSKCRACDKWGPSNDSAFHHEGIDWVLCEIDYYDYWENTDELLSDFKGYWL